MKPKESWKYNAVGRPALLGGRRAHAARGPGQRHHACPLHRDLPRLQPDPARPPREACARLHLQGQRPPDQGIADDGRSASCERRRRRPRPRPAKVTESTPPAPAPATRVTVVDLWVNALSGKAAEAFFGQRRQRRHPRSARGRPLRSIHPHRAPRHHGRLRGRRRRASRSASRPPRPTTCWPPLAAAARPPARRAGRRPPGPPVRQCARAACPGPAPRRGAGACHAAGRPVPAQRQALLPGL